MRRAYVSVVLAAVALTLAACGLAGAQDFPSRPITIVVPFAAGSGTDTLSFETFHAAEAVVEIRGIGVHPGYAKGIMVNAARILSEFLAALPAAETPESTEGASRYMIRSSL